MLNFPDHHRQDAAMLEEKGFHQGDACFACFERVADVGSPEHIVRHCLSFLAFLVSQRCENDAWDECRSSHPSF